MREQAFDKFLRSMNIGYEQWHDGIGYDMEALAALSPDELVRAEALIVARDLADWRDVEALDQIGSPRALQEMARATQLPALLVAMEAVKRLRARGLLSSAELEQLLLRALDHTTFANGMVKTLRLIEEHPTAALRKKLLWCAVHGHDGLRVHAAALASFLHGASKSSFDWEHRPLFLKFGEHDLAARRAAYLELCAHIGIAPEL